MHEKCTAEFARHYCWPLLLAIDQRNEANELTGSNHGISVDHANELQLLRIVGPYGNDHATLLAKLSDQSWRRFRSGGGDDDRVKRSDVGKAERTVSGNNLDSGIAK